MEVLATHNWLSKRSGLKDWKKTTTTTPKDVKDLPGYRVAADGSIRKIKDNG